jgi:hypothetical protein
MTKQEFIDRYCVGSLASRDFVLSYMDAYPCHCGRTGCHGWQMLTDQGAKLAFVIGQITLGELNEARNTPSQTYA